MSIPDLTAEGSGYYRTYVDGVEQSQHTTERKAIQRVYELREAHPEADVTYDHDYLVRVGGQTTVEEPVEEEPTTEPEPEPEPVDAEFVEDFSGFASIEDYLSDPHDQYMNADANAGNMALDERGLRYDWPALDPCDHYTIGRVLDLSSPNVLGFNPTELRVEIDATFEDGFDTSSPNRGRAVVQNVSGAFQVGERIAFSTHSGSPTLQRVDDNGDGTVTLWWNDVQDPAQGETVTGGSSGATGEVADPSHGCSGNPDLKFFFGLVVGGKGRFSVNVGNSLNRLILVDAPRYADGRPVAVCTDEVTGQESIDGDLECELRSHPNAWGEHNVFDGQSHRFLAHWRLPSAPGVVDGLLEVSVDGVLLHRTTGIETDATEFYGLKLGANTNISALDQSMWWEQIAVSGLVR